MPKPALEFFPLGSVDWVAVSPGVWERVLARDDDGVGLTRILRWDPGSTPRRSARPRTTTSRRC
jgi:hypothetical protein